MLGRDELIEAGATEPTIEPTEAERAAMARLVDEVRCGDKYLVWSNQHRAWWRPESRGYTTRVSRAGVYSKAQALRISFKGRDGWHEEERVPDELAVPLTSIPENLRPPLSGQMNEGEE